MKFLLLEPSCLFCAYAQRLELKRHLSYLLPEFSRESCCSQPPRRISLVFSPRSSTVEAYRSQDSNINHQFKVMPSLFSKSDLSHRLPAKITFSLLQEVRRGTSEIARERVSIKMKMCRFGSPLLNHLNQIKTSSEKCFVRVRVGKTYGT